MQFKMIWLIVIKTLSFNPTVCNGWGVMRLHETTTCEAALQYVPKCGNHITYRTTCYISWWNTVFSCKFMQFLLNRQVKVKWHPKTDSSTFSNLGLFGDVGEWRNPVHFPTATCGAEERLEICPELLRVAGRQRREIEATDLPPPTMFGFVDRVKLNHVLFGVSFLV